MVHLSTGRDALVDYLRGQTIGPVNGEQEELGDPPSSRYLCGVLFPQGASTSTVLEEEIDEDSPGGGVELADDPVAFAHQQLPAAVGVSFRLRGAGAVRCAVSAAVYTTAADADPADASAAHEPRRSRRGNRRWERRPLDPETVDLSPEVNEQKVLEGRATLNSRWRPSGDGWIVTVALVNAARDESPSLHEPSGCLFQVGLRCEPGPEAAIVSYPRVDRFNLDQEAEELELLYRNVRSYAIGHGCAATWDEPSEAGEVGWVAVEFIPRVDVWSVVPRQARSGVLLLRRLAQLDPGIVDELAAFVDEYAAWVSGLEQAAERLDERHRPAAGRVLDRLHTAVLRMRAGVDLLRDTNGDAAEAFRIANLAMLMQMRHTADDLGGGQPKDTGRMLHLPSRDEYLTLDKGWYPFQLAFLLLVLPGLVDVHDQWRDEVDLIWFPTGGGKTEAYLAVAAFQIALRRLRGGSRAGGATVITRYTLRLLTSQQFQRTATLVCALEELRRRDPARLGDEPITIGLWIGSDTPNDYATAVSLADEVYADPTPSSPFQLSRCPWCGTRAVPDRRSGNRLQYGFRASNNSFSLFCTHPDCPFHELLPVQVVDSALYAAPPTVLIGTVDKFARLSWVAEAGVFFGTGQGGPPSLIIQDELHLLAGPLGTTAGVYEAAIGALCELHGGSSPKVIASTATIREAGAQASGLFARQVRLFPPSGLEATDSYFARVDRTGPGRAYLGVLAPSHTPSTSLVRTCAALAQAPVELEERLNATELDAYWTQVIYHNSLRELGKTVTFARDDIPAWVRVIADDEHRSRDLFDDDVMELTGNVPSEEIPLALTRLSMPHGGKERPVSLVACTNMFSVGVDVQRLGLMVVNGQPKTTSEYIQASSRVGRNPNERPGLVVAHYSATRPRDRSHYENFRAYHEALYRYVEPTSVTPFALPSRERALHAALVIVVRHGAGLAANSDAANFDSSDARVVAAVDALRKRIALADPVEAGAACAELDRLCRDWDDAVQQAKRDRHPLVYSGSAPNRRLLRGFDDDPPGWPTLNSMRNVDRESAVEVRGITS